MKTGKPARILVVEDDDIVRDLIAAILRTNGYDVVEAMDGMSGLVAAKSEQPDLAVLDLHLPDFTGVELAGMIQPEVAFIVLTVDSTQAHVQACIDRGALGYLLKPPRAEDLVRQIQLAIRQGKEQQNLRRALQQTQTINKALGILMGYLGLSEEQAHRVLVARATAQRIKVADLAEQVIEAFHSANQFCRANAHVGTVTPEMRQARAFLKRFKMGIHLSRDS